jgi:[NiFe] hydrogenase assembly HybE family chaperone
LNAPTVISSDALVERYISIRRERMQGLPFVNQALEVEAIGFCPFNEHQLGVLITPWFMNLVILLKAGIGSTFPAGSKITVRLPSGPIEFTAACDDELGTFLSAVLFSSVGDIPDQITARDIAQEVMQEVFNPAHNEKTMSRRALFRQSEAADA